MSLIRVIILIIISVFITFTGWLYLTWVGFEKTLLNKDYYRFLITETELIEPIHEAISEQLFEQVEASLVLKTASGPEENGGPSIEEEVLDAEEIRSLKAELVTEALIRTFDQPWLREQLLHLIEELAPAEPESESSPVDITLDMRDKKEEFRQEIIIMLELMSEEALNEIGIDIEEIDTTAALMIDNLEIPDHFNMVLILEELGVLEEVDEFLEAAGRLGESMRYWPYIIFLIAILLTLVFAGPEGALKWIGSVMIIFSMLFLLALNYLEAALSIRLPGVDSVTIIEGISYPPILINMVIRNTFAEASWPSMAALFIGLVLLVGGIITGKLLPGNRFLSNK